MRGTAVGLEVRSRALLFSRTDAGRHPKRGRGGEAGWAGRREGSRAEGGGTRRIKKKTHKKKIKKKNNKKKKKKKKKK